MDKNQITLIGHLGTEILLKNIEKDGGEPRPVASFRFAVNSPFDDSAAWFSIECWGGLAEIVKKLNLHKGSRLYIEGKLVPDKDSGGPRAWIVEEGDKAGTAQSTFLVWAEEIIALDTKKID
jgi:single-strand DNA-binding protein